MVVSTLVACLNKDHLHISASIKAGHGKTSIALILSEYLRLKKEHVLVVVMNELLSNQFEIDNR